MIGFMNMNVTKTSKWFSLLRFSPLSHFSKPLIRELPKPPIQSEMAETFVDFLLEDLKMLLNNSSDWFLAEKNEIEELYKDLNSIKTFLCDLGSCNEQKELIHIVTHIRDIASKALNYLDFFVLRVVSGNYKSMAGKIGYAFHHCLNLRNFRDEIKSIKKVVMENSDKKLYCIGIQKVGISPTENFLRAITPSVEEEEIVVGFDDETMTIKKRLAGDQKQLEIIPVIGMAGLGKTTLARKVYNDSYIRYHFNLRGWTYASQVYRKKDMLLGILSSVIENRDEFMSEERLGEVLYRCLKGQRYLIVLDDIWSINAWNELRRYFPDDNKGSRIMITTRDVEIAREIKQDIVPHFLHFLTEDESWDLLQQKVFREKISYPPELMEIGKQIAVKCQGLPLAIVVVAGILAKNEKTRDLWQQVSENTSSYMVGEKQLMDILAMSYNHLPRHLKLCFLYFGAFPEDYEIHVWNLTWLWIAEGFVEQIEQRSLEDIAEDYLMDLINRSMVIVVKGSTKGGIKVCRVHDMLRDLCLEKAKEENWLQQINDWYGRLASPSTTISHDSYRCFHSHGFHNISGEPCVPRIRCVFSYHSERSLPTNVSTIAYIYKHLRVLNLRCIYLDKFPEEVVALIHLRFLELRLRYLKLPPQISNLHNLETLIIDKGEWGRAIIPHTIWNMVKLRHIRISDDTKFEKPILDNVNPSRVLGSLQSISALPLSHSSKDSEYVLARTPNLRKLAFYRGPCQMENPSLPDLAETSLVIKLHNQGTSHWQSFCLPDLANLIHLETLKLIDNASDPTPSKIPNPSKFPLNLRKITLSGGHVPWTEISNLGKLPNLEVLKLRRNSFKGPLWETNDGEFCRLKLLKLSWMNLQQWITNSSHFPRLERLELNKCDNLDEIPSSLGDIPTLEIIGIYWSRHSAAFSARRIQEEQHGMGNDVLKIDVYPPNEISARQILEATPSDCHLF